MRLVTRCPACATTFKVVRDQLRISDGWVRCGRCSEVFDATLDLHEAEDDGTPIPSPASKAAAAATSVQENLLPLSTGMGLPAMAWPAADLLDLGPTPAALPTAPGDAKEAEPPAALNGRGAQEPWFDDETQVKPQALRTPAPSEIRQEPGFTPSLTTASPIEEAVNAQLQKALRRERIKALRRERAEQKERERAAAQTAAGAASSEPKSQPEPEPESLPETPLLEAPSAPASFADVTAADAPAQSSRVRRLLLALGCLLALAALVLQVLHHERDAVVAREPQLRPLLQAWCRWSGCELSALRQIGSVTIDGASFTREKEGEAYRLHFTLRNGARVPLAMPSIELTLLDTQERALVRRVLSPAQFGAPAVLGAGAERSASLPMQLAGSEAAGLAPVAGYRVIAFYP